MANVLSKAGFHVLTDRVDLVNEKAVKEYAETVKNKFGSIFAIIHAASAPIIRKKVLDQTSVEFTKQFEVNVIGAFNLFKFFSQFTEAGGAFIGILSSDILANTNHVLGGAYIPAKYGLRGLLRVLSEELTGQGIRVYGVSPAFMPGGLNRDIPKLVRDFIVKKSQLQDVTCAEEVAEFILDLVNDKMGVKKSKLLRVPGNNVIDL